MCVLWARTSVGKLNWLLICCVKGLAANANCIYVSAGLLGAPALNLWCWLRSPNLTATTPNGCVGNGPPTLQTPIVMVCCTSGPVLLTGVRNPNLRANWVGDHWGYNWVGSRNVNVPPIGCRHQLHLSSGLDQVCNFECVVAAEEPKPGSKHPHSAAGGQVGVQFCLCEHEC